MIRMKNYLLFAIVILLFVAGFYIDGILFGDIPEYMLF